MLPAVALPPAAMIAGERVCTQQCLSKPPGMILVIHKLPIDQLQQEIRSKPLKGIIRL